MKIKNNISVVSVVVLLLSGSFLSASEGTELSQDAVNLAKTNLTIITESHKTMIRTQFFGELKKQKMAIQIYEKDVESELTEQVAEFYQNKFTAEELKEVMKILNSDLYKKYEKVQGESALLVSQLTFSSLNASSKIIEEIKSEE